MHSKVIELWTWRECNARHFAGVYEGQRPPHPDAHYVTIPSELWYTYNRALRALIDAENALEDVIRMEGKA